MERDTDRRRGLRLVPVSRETEARLEFLVDGLRRWQGVKNLVGPSALDEVWTRHVADSAQLLALAPEARRWADLGAGAGFPGLVIAIQLVGRPGAAVHLIEANARKCAFLREVARATGAPAVVHNGRIEAVLPALTVDIVTARALAPLPRLIEFSKIALDRGSVGLFPKGRAELLGLDLSRLGVDCRLLPSRTSSDGGIVRVAAAP